MLGDEDRAFPFLTEALELSRANGNLKAEGFLRATLGAISANRGDFNTAEEHFLNLLEKKTAEQDNKGVSLAHCHLGHLYLRQESTGIAHSHYRQGITLAAAAPDYYLLGGNLAAASSILLEAGDPYKAAAIQGYAERILERTGAIPDKLFVLAGSQIKERTRKLLSPSEYDSALKSGRKMSINEVLEALGCSAVDNPESYPLSAVVMSE